MSPLPGAQKHPEEDTSCSISTTTNTSLTDELAAIFEAGGFDAAAKI